MKLHTTLISGALVTAVAVDERRPGNSRLRYLKVNKQSRARPLIMSAARWCYHVNSCCLDNRLGGWSSLLETAAFVASDGREIYFIMSHAHDVSSGPVNGRSQPNSSVAVHTASNDRFWWLAGALLF